jgi:hypothetical protein
MAQGTIKASKLANSSKGKKPTGLPPKKGARTIAPRKQVLVNNAKMTKVGYRPDLSTHQEAYTDYLMCRNTHLASQL